jgi:hypothetical protein
VNLFGILKSNLLYLYWSPPLPDFPALWRLHVIVNFPTRCAVLRRWSHPPSPAFQLHWHRYFVLGILNWAGLDARLWAERVAGALARLPQVDDAVARVFS